MKNTFHKTEILYTLIIYTDAIGNIINDLPIPSGDFLPPNAYFEHYDAESVGNKLIIKGIITTSFSKERLERLMLGFEGKLKNHIRNKGLKMSFSYEKRDIQSRDTKA